MEGIIKRVEQKELLEKATDTIKEKYTTSIFTPAEEYTHLYDLLEVWDRDREDTDIQDKTKRIYDYLITQGNPKDLLLSIYTSIGATPINEKRIERVYRYIRLREEADKALSRYEDIQKQINTIKEKKNGTW